ncbi:ribonuclease T2 family protein [Xylariaceae sp. FL0804]|nr:ribonuclease T2 family protein [Xylariaceae sp. FL0804]
MAPSLQAVLAYAGNLFQQNPLAGELRFPSSSSSSSNPPSVNAAGGGLRLPSFFDRTTTTTTTPYTPLSGAPSCPIDGPTSCRNETAGDACCIVHPGGRLLLTMFWDEEAHGGREEDWTVHGLWPDLCDGSYDQYCGMTPRFNNITEILKHYDQGELLANMNRYWLANYGTNDHLWAHEYNKHATCINTLAPSCYGDDYRAGVEVVDYFTRAFGLFRMLDAYQALAAAGIEPTHEHAYTRDEVQGALEAHSGGRVVLKCSGHGRDVLHEAWFVYFVQGSLQSGEFVPTRDAFRGGDGNCPDRVRYLPKKSRHHQQHS